MVNFKPGKERIVSDQTQGQNEGNGNRSFPVLRLQRKREARTRKKPSASSVYGYIDDERVNPETGTSGGSIKFQNSAG